MLLNARNHTVPLWIKGGSCHNDMNTKNKVLVIAGDYWHPAEVIRLGLSTFPESPFEFDLIEAAKDILTPEMAEAYSAILICKGNSISSFNHEPWFEDTVTEMDPAAFRSYAERGGLLMIIHAGNAWAENYVDSQEKFSRPNREYLDMIGCTFNGHPLRCPVTYHVTDPESPITKGVQDFTQRDEHYQMTVTAPDAKVFLTSSSLPGKTCPAGFERPLGKGKLIDLTPGHTLAVWKNANFQHLILNALSYGCGGPSSC